MKNKGYNKPLFIVAVIFTAVTFILGLALSGYGKSIPEPTGTVLTQEFIENYANRRVFMALGRSILGGTFLWGVTIILSFIWNIPRVDKIRKYCITAVTVFFALACPIFESVNSIPVLVNKPRVENVVVIGKLERYGRKNTTYRLRFTDGSTCLVSFPNYNDVPDRSTYYVIMCGSRCAGAFDPDTYSLPDFDNEV